MQKRTLITNGVRAKEPIDCNGLSVATFSTKTMILKGFLNRRASLIR